MCTLKRQRGAEYSVKRKIRELNIWVSCKAYKNDTLLTYGVIRIREQE